MNSPRKKRKQDLILIKLFLKDTFSILKEKKKKQKLNLKCFKFEQRFAKFILFWNRNLSIL